MGELTNQRNDVIWAWDVTGLVFSTTDYAANRAEGDWPYPRNLSTGWASGAWPGWQAERSFMLPAAGNERP